MKERTQFLLSRLGLPKIGFGFRRRFGGLVFDGRRGSVAAFGLRLFDVVQGAVEGALGRIDPALRA